MPRRKQSANQGIKMIKYKITYSLNNNEPSMLFTTTAHHERGAIVNLCKMLVKSDQDLEELEISGVLSIAN